MDIVLLQPGNSDFVSACGELNDSMGAALNDSGEDFPSLNFIELASWHGGIKQQVATDISNGARTSGRPVVADITCVKYLDQTSPLLYHHCLTAKPIDDGGDANTTKIVLLRGESNGSPTDDLSLVFVIELRDALIAEIQQQSHPDDMATEQFVLNFTAIRWRYGTTPSNAPLESRRSSSWSVARNRPNFD